MKNALIIASDMYEDPKLKRLRAPAVDAEALAQVLGDSEIGGFDVDVILNEPEYMVRRRLSGFFADRDRDDLLWVHFSGHGVKDDDGHLYFATSDTEMDNLDATAVAAEFVNRQMARSRSNRIALFLDCCYSGAFSQGTQHRAGEEVDLAQRFDGRGRVVVTASTAMEYSFEGDDLSGTGMPSVFTSALVDGLRTGAADLDGDSFVSVDELYEWIYDEVRAKTPNQTPSKWAYDLRGDLYLARAPEGTIKRADLPSDLQDAIGSTFVGAREIAVVELERLLGGRHRGLALAARDGLERLAEDDSRRVSSAARDALARVAAGIAVPTDAVVEPQPALTSDISTEPERTGPIEPALPAPVETEPLPAVVPDAETELHGTEPPSDTASSRETAGVVDGLGQTRQVDDRQVEKAEREAAEQAKREKTKRDAARREKAKRERAEREAAEQAERERAEREAAERAKREKAKRDRARRAKAKRERAEREAAEQAERERAEREAAERAKREGEAGQGQARKGEVLDNVDGELESPEHRLKIISVWVGRQISAQFGPEASTIRKWSVGVAVGIAAVMALGFVLQAFGYE